MNDYISRDDVLKAIDYQHEVNNVFESEAAYVQMWETINDDMGIKSADVQCIKHGRWIAQGDDMWLCSNRNENIIFSMHESDRIEKQRYCCKCGARMDGDTE